MGRKAIEYDNSRVVKALSEYPTWYEAARVYRCLDGILSGGCTMDHHNNTRPLSMATMYRLLSTLPALTTNAVAEAGGFKKSHASEVRRTLQLVSAQFEQQLANPESERVQLQRGGATEIPSAEVAATERKIAQEPFRPKRKQEARQTRTPQEALLAALSACQKVHGTTLYTALRCYNGDIGAVLMKVLGRGDNPALVEAGVLLVEHDVDAPVRLPLRKPPTVARPHPKSIQHDGLRPSRYRPASVRHTDSFSLVKPSASAAAS